MSTHLREKAEGSWRGNPLGVSQCGTGTNHEVSEQGEHGAIYETCNAGAWDYIEDGWRGS